MNVSSPIQHVDPQACFRLFALAIEHVEQYLVQYPVRGSAISSVEERPFMASEL